MGAIAKNKSNSNPRNRKLRQNGPQKKRKQKGRHPNKTDLKSHTTQSNARKEISIAENLKDLSKVVYHTNCSPVKMQEKNNDSQVGSKKRKLNIKKLQGILAVKECQVPKVPVQKIVKTESLRERMMARLRASRFRYLNETLYNNESSESKKYFKDDPDAFVAYHNGYKQQIDQWPVNPLDVIISSIQKMPKEYVIADFGCGEARLSSSVTQKVHSFDFVSLNERVTACDMAHTPLLMGAVNVVVFCLSLMGTNLRDYLIEANRVLKKDGILKIAEVESRFEKVEEFVSLLGEYGFTNTWTDLSHNLFYFLDFKKEKDIGGNKNKLPPITLKACLYKKR